LNGRRFTIAFVVLLLTMTALGIGIALRFRDQLAALSELRRAWPAIATLIEPRYQQIQAQIQAGQRLPPEWSDTDLETWTDAWEDFQMSKQYDIQAKAVPILERIAVRLEELSPPQNKITVPGEATKSFIQADQRLQQLENDWLGRFCSAIFRFNVPPRIHALLPS
jgi:hypothetical protein